MKSFSIETDDEIFHSKPQKLLIAYGISDTQHGYALIEALDGESPESVREAAHRLIDKFFDQYIAQNLDTAEKPQ